MVQTTNPTGRLVVPRGFSQAGLVRDSLVLLASVLARTMRLMGQTLRDQASQVAGCNPSLVLAEDLKPLALPGRKARRAGRPTELA